MRIFWSILRYVFKNSAIYIYNFTEVQVSRERIIVLLLQNCFVWCKDHTHQAILTTELLELDGWQLNAKYVLLKKRIYIYIYIYIRYLSRTYFVERSTQLVEEHQLQLPQHRNPTPTIVEKSLIAHQKENAFKLTSSIKPQLLLRQQLKPTLD